MLFSALHLAINVILLLENTQTNWVLLSQAALSLAVIRVASTFPMKPYLPGQSVAQPGTVSDILTGLEG